jgi:hypothetical protein
VASGQASYITISGLTGTATSNNDLGIMAPKWAFSPKFEKGTGKWTQSTGTLELKLDAGACVPPTVWASGNYFDMNTHRDAPFAVGGRDKDGGVVQADGSVTVAGSAAKFSGLPGTTAPSVCVKAGYLYVFSFQIQNPGTEQAAPSVSISGRYRDLGNEEVMVDAVTIDAPIKGDEDKIPLKVSDQTLTTVKIGQLIPAPAAINVICVTLQSSKDIKSQPNAPLSSITISGLTGFDASEQDLKLYENDGITTITPSTGNPF